MKFLGTGAGEGIPNPFCTCRICENARRVKGKEVRTRSSFMLSDKVIIDIGADFFAQALSNDVCFADVEHVLYTHMHHDHMNYNMIWERFVRREGGANPLNIYVVEDAYNFFSEHYANTPVTEGKKEYLLPNNANVIKLNFEKKYKIDNFTVTPLKGAHNTLFEKNSANYLIEHNNKKLYYALDSGYFLEETFSKLKDSKLDIFIGECTFPVENNCENINKSVHMNLSICIKNLDRLYEINAITKDTKIYLSHIASMGMTHEEIKGYFSKLNRDYTVQVAYDGLNI